MARYTIRAGMAKTEMLAEMPAMEKLIKVVGAIVALGTFLWAIWTYGDTRRTEIKQQVQGRQEDRRNETRRGNQTVLGAPVEVVYGGNTGSSENCGVTR